jgi:outer membrane protein
MLRFFVAAVLGVMALHTPAFAQAPPPAAAVPPQQAALRMAFLDLQRIAAESAEGKVLAGRIQELTKKKTAELQEKTKALQTNQQKLQQGGSVLNDAARAQTQREIDRLTLEIDRYQEDANAEVQELQQQLQKEFEEKLRPVVDGLVKELTIGLLFSAAEAGAIYVDPSLDITAEVIKRFNAAKPAAPVPAAAKPAAPAPTTKPSAPATGKPAAPEAVPPAAPPATPKPATPTPPAKP